MTANKDTKSLLKGKNVYSYYCSCGFTTNVQMNYKYHVFEEHLGISPDNSSHFIAHMTDLILPNPLRNHYQMQFVPFSDSQDQNEKVLMRGKGDQLMMKEAPIMVKESNLYKGERNKDKVKRGRGRPKRKKSIDEKQKIKLCQQKVDHQKIGQKDESLKSQVQLNHQIQLENRLSDESHQFSDENKNLFQQQKIQVNDEWNGFKLIKNKKINSNFYSCGQCNLSFNFIQNFIVHCIEECQELRHPNSSHFIKHSEQNQSIIEALQDSDELQQNKNYQYKKMTRITKYTYNSNELRYLLKNEQNIDYNFFCPCNREFHNKKQYFRHINTLQHGQIITSKFSHIILRYTWQNNTRIFYQYIQILCNKDTQKYYYCPCNVETKMDLKTFIKHILEVHKGISPIYFVKWNYNRIQ